MGGPFFPPMSPYVLPAEPFEKMIDKYGVRLYWMRSHSCACVYGNLNSPGAPDPGCNTCQGVGFYWESPIGPFSAMITFMHMAPTPDESGEGMNMKWGELQHGDPTLTITNSSSGISSTVYANASQWDAYIQLDSVARFTVGLQVSGVEAVPYQQGLTIAATGAVTVYDTSAKRVVTVSGYVVSGARVIMPSGYVPDTGYMVEFTANPVWIAFRKAGGLPHNRPFGNGAVDVPKRFRLQPLDAWTRARTSYPNSTSPQSLR